MAIFAVHWKVKLHSPLSSSLNDITSVDPMTPTMIAKGGLSFHIGDNRQ